MNTVMYLGLQYAMRYLSPIQVWSPFRLPSTSPSVGKDLFKERPVYSHEDYINLVLRNGSMMTHDYTEASTEEDPRMIAFFDSLVQRELEGWSSDDTLSSNEEAMYTRIMQLSSSDTDSTISSIGSLDGTLGTVGVDDLDDSNANSDIPESSSVTDSGLGTSRTASFASLSVSRVMHGGRANSPVSPVNKGKKLSKLIRKKKEGLKDSFYRNRATLNLSSSSDSSSDEEPVKTVIQKGAPGKSVKGKNPIAVQNLMKQRQQAMQASFVKLKRLNTLRNQVLNSDSDTEINIGTKEMGESVKPGGEKDETKEVKNVYHKGKKHTETTSMGPYVHEMCHIFEVGSPTEPVCSTSFGDNNTTSSSTSVMTKNDTKSSDLRMDTVMQFVEKSKYLSSDKQNETNKMSNPYKSKWKPIGSDSSVTNNHSSFHNDINCDSNQASLVNNKHTTSDMHDDFDNSQHEDCDNSITDADKTEVVVYSQATDSKGPVNDDNDVKSVDINSANFCFSNRIDNKTEHAEVGIKNELESVSFQIVDENELVNGCNSVSADISEKLHTKGNDSLHKPNKETVDCTSVSSFPSELPISAGPVLLNEETLDDSNKSNSTNLPTKDRFEGYNKTNSVNLPTKDNLDNTDEHKAERSNARKEISKLQNLSESKTNDNNMPSCSKWSLDQSLLSDYKNPDSPEVYRAAWTEFKKRKKSDDSKKHYRGHKRSDRHGSWD